MRVLKPSEARQVAGGWFFCLKKSWSWNWCKPTYTKSSCHKRTYTKNDCKPTKPETPAEPPVYT